MTTHAPAPSRHHLNADPTTDGEVVVLDHAAAAVPVARARVARRLGHLPPDLLDDTLLVLSELLGNAVRHAAATADGSLEVRWSLVPGAVHLEVVDGGGGGEPRVSDPGEHAVSGRGMAIVEALSQSWGTTRLGCGCRTVWARVAA